MRVLDRYSETLSISLRGLTREQKDLMLKLFGNADTRTNHFADLLDNYQIYCTAKKEVEAYKAALQAREDLLTIAKLVIETTDDLQDV